MIQLQTKSPKLQISFYQNHKKSPLYRKGRKQSRKLL